MLKLGNKPLAYDRAFTDPKTGIQYPANWLRMASLADKQAIGIVEVADPARYDQRFYWGVGNPKDLGGLKTVWSNKQNDIAASLLAPSDWRIIKAKETGSNIPSAWKTYRAAVRTSCNARQAEVAAVTTVEALIELFFGNSTVTRQKTDGEGNGLVEADTISQQKTDEAGNGLVEPDTIQQQKKDEAGELVVDAEGNAVMEDVANPLAGNPIMEDVANPVAGDPIMETVANPALATAWPDPVS